MGAAFESRFSPYQTLGFCFSIDGHMPTPTTPCHPRKKKLESDSMHPVIEKIIFIPNILYRLVVFLGCLIPFVSLGIVARVFVWQLSVRRGLHAYALHFFCRLFLWLTSTRVQAHHRPRKKEHFLLVGNHLGLLDILIHSSLRPTLFITSHEMRKAPGLGFLTEMGASLYVDRKNRANIQNEVLNIREALQQGFNVMLFPEATSTPGDKIYPFKKTLMTAAAGTRIPILPVVINFRKVNGEKMSDKFRDWVFWYGDISFPYAFYRILSMRSIDVDVDYFDPIHIHSDEERREVAGKAQALIESKFTPIPWGS